MQNHCLWICMSWCSSSWFLFCCFWLRFWGSVIHPIEHIWIHLFETAWINVFLPWINRARVSACSKWRRWRVPGYEMMFLSLEDDIVSNLEHDGSEMSVSSSPTNVQNGFEINGSIWSTFVNWTSNRVIKLADIPLSK